MYFDGDFLVLDKARGPNLFFRILHHSSLSSLTAEILGSTSLPRCVYLCKIQVLPLSYSGVV